MSKELTQKHKYTKYIKSQKKIYSNYSIRKESSTKQFIENIVIFNKNTNTSKSLKYDYLQNAKDNYLWFVFNQKLLEDKIEKLGGYSAIFITLTLPSSFHKYSTKKKAYNHEYNENDTIAKGYSLLNSAFRSIYNKFKVNKKFVKTYYSRVIEPHKNFTPHLHSIVYVPTVVINEFKKHILNNIKSFELGEQYQIEVIKDIERSSAYLLKYIAKNTNPNNDKDFHKFNGWKKMHRIRVFTQSQCELPRYIFKRVNSVLGLSKGLENKNPIREILDKCLIKVDTYHEDKYLSSSKTYGNTTNPIYSVYIGREKSKHEVIKGVDLETVVKREFNVCKLNNLKLEDRLKLNKLHRVSNDLFFKIEKFEGDYNVGKFQELEKNVVVEKEIVTQYKIKDFLIVEVDTNQIRYDKRDFEIDTNYFLNQAIEENEYKKIIENKIQEFVNYLDFERI